MPVDDVVTSLPDRPLTSAETETLDRHRSIRACKPLFQLADDSNGIVAVFLEIDARTSFLVFNPRDEQWERRVTADTPESLADSTDFEFDAALDVVDHYYNEADVTVVERLTEPHAAWVDLFPQEPLSDDQFEAINQHEVVLDLIPLTRRRGDDALVALYLLTVDLDGRGIITGVGYDPDAGTWEVVDTLQRSDLDRYDELSASFDAWMESRYSDEEVRPADIDPEPSP